MKIACAFDHAGFTLRDEVLGAVVASGHEVIDMGVRSAEPVDYPDVARKVGRAISNGLAERGILVCGSGAGVSVAASKIDGVRAATIHDEYSAHQAVEHDDVNVLCLGSRVIGGALAKEIVARFLAAEVSNEERHVRRRAKTAQIESENQRLRV
ncbi:MAG: RpiB/LacA/LacB family sugar-phosphate isomerase [Solirubrobacterales bacterium]|nr:RpiB/LacA/LacB family sugar-phosphate isomerase [Solirubrobacterales bacterium]